MDLANLIVGIVGILIGLLSARIAMRHDRKLAEESGAFKKPDIGIAIFNCPIGYGYPDNKNWIFIHPGGDNDYALYPIQFTIFNQGDTSTQEVLISFQVPKRIFWKEQLDGMSFVTYPSVMSENIKQSVDELGNFTLVSFLISPLSPGSAASLFLPFSFKPTIVNASLPTKLTNNLINPKITLFFHNTISITINSGDLSSKHYELNMGAISSSSLADGVQKFRNLKNLQPQKNLINRVLDVFRFAEFNITNFVFFEIESTTKVKNFKAFVMKSPNQYYRSSWLNIPSNNTSELKNLETGEIVGVIDIEIVPSSRRKFRFKEGNLTE